MTNADASQKPTLSAASAPAGRKKRAWWETSDTRRIYSKYALRRLFGYDGYQKIKTRNWTTTSLALLALGIVSDISEIFGPITEIGLYTSVIAASILGIVILKRLRFCDLCVVPFVLSVIFAVIFGGVALAQNSDATPGNGVIADFIPGVTEFQKLILGALFEIKTTADDTNARVTELQEQIDALSQQHNKKYDEILAKIETTRGISKSALSEHLVKLGARQEIPVDEIPNFLERFADDYQALQERLLALDVNDTQLETIRRYAAAMLDSGDVPGARRVLRNARETIKSGRETSASREATLLADEAAIDNLDLNYNAAAEKYVEAADLIAFDRENATDYKFSAADALHKLGVDFGDSNALHQAIRLNTEILQYYTRDRVPLSWAVTQNNLGNSLSKLAENTGDLAHLQSAIIAYQNALKEYTRSETPLEWAMVQNNLGAALLVLSDQQGGTELPKAAIEAFRNSLLERARERTPIEWATSKSNLGNAYRQLGHRTNDPGLLEDAVMSYRDALKEWTLERAPAYWVVAQSNLGTTLADLGDFEAGTKRFEDAIEIFDNTLSQIDRTRTPLAWATLQNNKGTALTAIGQREGNPDRLQQAIDALRNALLERTRERVPLDWANSQNNLGRALGSLGWQIGNAQLIQDSIAAHGNALNEFTYERVPLDWVSAYSDQGYAHRALGDTTQQVEPFVISAEHFNTLIEANLEWMYPDNPALGVSEFHHGMCWSLIRAAEVSGQTQYLQNAEPACLAAYAATASETENPLRLDTLYNLAYLKLTFAKMMSDMDLAREALVLFQQIEDDPLTSSENPVRPGVPQELDRVRGLLDSLAK